MTVQLDATSPLFDLATSWARSLRAARRSPNTIEVYLRGVFEYDRFAQQVGLARDVARIRRSDVEAFLEDQIERCAPATAALRYSALKRFLGWCVDESEISSSPMAKIMPPKVPETTPKVLTDLEVVAILKAAEGPTFRHRRDHAVLSLMRDTGFRRSEVAGIRLEDVDFESQLIGVVGKGEKPRTVGYSNATAVALDRYLRLRKAHRCAESGALFLSQSGPLTGEGVADLVALRSRRAGVFRIFKGRQVPINPHSFRHYFADRALRNGVQEGALMELGGWASSDVMRRYGRGNRTERALDAQRAMFATA